MTGNSGSRSGYRLHSMSVKYRQQARRTPCSSSHSKPGRKSVPPASLDGEPVRQFVRSVLVDAAQRGVDLKNENAFGAKFSGDRADFGPGALERRHMDRARRVDDQRDGVHALGANRRQVQPRHR